TTIPPIVDPLTLTSGSIPTNILDIVIQHDNPNTDDSDDEVDVVELNDDTLYNLNFTPIKVDESYFNDTFVCFGT
ncbi:hypothetical protein KI387_025600, partial [Taxus chinensis]